MHSDLLKASISRFVSLTEDEFDTVSKYFRERTFEKREHLLPIGDVCNDIAFILSGCLRYYFLKDGAERTGQFFFEGGWITDYESWLTKQPAQIGIDAVERTKVLTVSFRDIESLYTAIPKFERLGRLMAENTIIGIRKRNISLLNESPEERYLALMKERPKVIQRVPQHMIASFLGIEPETLSRIRKKIAEKK